MSVLIFFAVLFVLILVHEWGHFIVAKKNGIRVDEFGIGFPPKLFGIKKGETEYTFNSLPIGGFVRIYGENAEDAAHDAEKGKDVSRSFVAKSKWVQAAVLIAGVAMNVFFAWFLYSAVYALGVPTQVDEASAGPEARLVITEVFEGPASEAAIPVGATIVGLAAGEASSEALTPTAFSEFTKTHGNDTLEVTYTLGEETVTKDLTPQIGIIESDPDRPAVGVALALVDNVRMPAHIAVWEGLRSTGNTLKNIVTGLGTLLYQSIQWKADISQVAGPIGIVGLVGDAAQFGFANLMLFTAFISLNLAVINLLPIPALDGGRLVFVAIEAIRKKPVDPVWFARVNFVGFAFLMLLMLAVTVSDISKFF